MSDEISDNDMESLSTFVEKLLSTSLPVEPSDTLLKFEEPDTSRNPIGGFSWFDFQAREWVLLIEKDPIPLFSEPLPATGFGLLPVGSKIYRFGGKYIDEDIRFDYYNRHGTFEVLDLIGDREWHYVDKLPMKLFEKQPVEMDGKIYYHSNKEGQFQGPSPVNYLNCYSIENHRWSKPIPIPPNLNEFILDLYALTGSLYLTVSYKNGPRVNSGTWTPHRYSPATGQWSALTGWPKGITDMLAYGSKFYAQIRETDSRNTLKVYSPGTELWQSLKYPENVESFTKLFSFHGQLCGLDRDDLYQFMPEAGSFSRVLKGKDLNASRIFVAKTMLHHNSRDSLNQSTSGVSYLIQGIAAKYEY